MNIYQRIVLILGALALLVVILGAPYVEYYKGEIMHATVIDWRTVLTLSIVIAGITIFVWFALGTTGKGKKRGKK